MAERYEDSPFGGVDIWLILGLAVFIVPVLGVGLGVAGGYINLPK